MRKFHREDDTLRAHDVSDMGNGGSRGSAEIKDLGTGFYEDVV